MKTILTVDDSLSMRQMLEVTLSAKGYNVIQAEDGVEAMEVVENQSFDLALIDINMPRMNGYELLERLRQENRYRFKPMLILTTEASKEAKMKGRAAGATGWMVKPFDPEILLATIEKVLNRA